MVLSASLDFCLVAFLTETAYETAGYITVDVPLP